LLLNTCLTVRAHQANSHANQGWEQFTQKIIDIVCMYGGANLNKTGVSKGVVFLAWGAPAAKRVDKVDKVRFRLLNDPAGR
jgi:uracil-DNA glycosylase